MDQAFIDKLAFIEIQNRRLLVTQSRGKDAWYIPGGKRENGETDAEALVREVKEELSVAIDPSSMQRYGEFEAQAHGKPEGTLVRMTCYTAKFTGTLKPSAEIEQLAFFSHKEKNQCSCVDHLIFDDLKVKDLID